MENILQNGAAHPHPNTEHLTFSIEGKQFSTIQQYYVGIELKQLVGIPEDVPLYLSIPAPYEHELIENDTRVNIARPEVELFFVRDEDKLQFFINDQSFISYKQFISGKELRLLGNIPADESLVLDLPGKWQDDFITEDEIVDLAREGKERFVSKPTVVQYTIYVNTREKIWKKEAISFEELVGLSSYSGQTNCGITIAYTGGLEAKPEGILVKGTSVAIKNNMSFNVTPTVNS